MLLLRPDRIKSFLFVIFLLLATNGIFSTAGDLSDEKKSFSEVIDAIPMFVEDNTSLIKLKSVNRSLFLLSGHQIKSDVLESISATSFLTDYIEKRIRARGKYSIERLGRFLMRYNKDIDYHTARLFASYYIDEARVEGINSDIAFVQMCLETGFLKFGGIVKPGQNNFCGLGAVNSATLGNHFPTRRHGVRAHIQHLKAYVSNSFPRNALVDQRFHLVNRGSVITIEDLTGKWATDPDYARKLVGLLKRLKKTDMHSDGLFLTAK